MGTPEDYAHHLLELNGLTCQRNRLLQQDSNHYCAQSAVGVVIPSDLTATEAYQLGKDLGQQEYQHFTVLVSSPKQSMLSGQLLVLMDWWSQSYLAYYGQLFIDLTQLSVPYIRLQVVDTSHISLRKNRHRPDCAFYAGIIAGFFSGLTERNFEVIQPDCVEALVNSCQFLLASQSELNAQIFWQTVDTLTA